MVSGVFENKTSLYSVNVNGKYIGVACMDLKIVKNKRDLLNFRDLNTSFCCSASLYKTLNEKSSFHFWFCVENSCLFTWTDLGSAGP